MTKPAKMTIGRRAANFVVVTGLSGAGKSQAIRALEDLGYFCVDNLPVALIPTFAEHTLRQRHDARPAAVVVDVREGKTLADFPAIYRQLKRRSQKRIRLIFLEAADSALIRRFSETRRPHPLGAGLTVSESLAEERRLLQPMRALADQVLDTSALSVHELRRRILETTSGSRAVGPLMVTVLSFGFRRGVPEDADMMLDVRFLPNPYFVSSLRRWSGRHVRVSNYVLQSPKAKRFLSLSMNLLRYLMPLYINEGKTYLTIAIGCTGGRHRSVAIAREFAARLKGTRGIQVQVRHRDVDES